MEEKIAQLAKKSANPDLIRQVAAFAKKAYGTEKRPSGEGFFEHALRVAQILQSMRIDDRTIAAGMLHDISQSFFAPRYQQIHQEIATRFGEDIADTVDRISQVKKIYYSFNVKEKSDRILDKDQAENLRKMFLAIAKDLRAVMIELASRIDGLHHIQQLSREQQKLYAIETMQIFAPIANRLGLGEMKSKLEDLSFACLFPERFKLLRQNIAQKYEERQRYFKKFIPKLEKILKKEGIAVSDISYRAKSYWSAYQKLIKYQMDFERIHDLVAIRVIVPDVESCYKTLGTIHAHYPPISEEINDYIVRPKANGYKSLHTTVFLAPGRISEIQIRTPQMHREAEYGVCAHWSYKEKIPLEKGGEHLVWTEKIPEFQRTLKIDFFENQVFCFTPRGDVIMLPKESTPVDFAYAIHSDIGNHCESAKISGKIVPLSYILNNGDVVEIIINKHRKPSADWLKFIKTNFAKIHIRKEMIAGIPSAIFSIPRFITKKISEISEKTRARPPAEKSKGAKPQHVYIAGQKDMLVHMAKCCAPRPGDPAKAYLTKHRAAVLHKTDCPNLKKLARHAPEKVIHATWKPS